MNKVMSSGHFLQQLKRGVFSLHSLPLLSCFLSMSRELICPGCPGLPLGSSDVKVESRSYAPGAKRDDKGPLDHCSTQMLGFLQILLSLKQRLFVNTSSVGDLTTYEDSIFHLGKLSVLESFPFYIGHNFFFLKHLPFVLSSVSQVHAFFHPSHDCLYFFLL